MVFSFAIARVPVYTAILNLWNSCSQRFGVGVVLNSTNYFLSTWGAYGALLWISIPSNVYAMMMIAFITFKSSLVPLFEGLWSSNSWEFELSGFRRNRTDDLGIDSPSLWPTEPRLHVRSIYSPNYIYIIFEKFFFWFLVCMLCRSKFLIIPNSHGPEALN